MSVTVREAGEGFPAADGWTSVVRLEPAWASRELPPVPVPVSVRGFCPSYLARLRTWLRPLLEPNPSVESAVADERDAMLPVFGSPERTLAGFAWLAETAVRAAGWSGWPPSPAGELEAAVHVPGGDPEVRWSDPGAATESASGPGAAAGAPSAAGGPAGESSLLDLLARADLGSPPDGGEPVTMDGLKATAGGLFAGDAATDGGPERPVERPDEGGTAVLASASPYLLTLGLRLAYNELLTVYAAWLGSAPVRAWLDDATAASRRLASLLYEPQPAWPDRPLVAAVTRDDRVELRPLPPFADFARRAGPESLDGMLAGAMEGDPPAGAEPERWRSFLAERAAGRPAPPPVRGAASDDDGPASGLRADLAAVVAESAELPGDELRAVAERAWYGLEFGTIAERSGRPEGRLRRAYLSGRRRLAGAEPLLELLR